MLCRGMRVHLTKVVNTAVLRYAANVRGRWVVSFVSRLTVRLTDARGTWIWVERGDVALDVVQPPVRHRGRQLALPFPRLRLKEKAGSGTA